MKNSIRVPLISCGMFLIATAAAGSAVNIDVGRQLFLDDSLIDEMKAVRTWHRPKKDARN